MNTQEQQQVEFPLGQIVATPGALEALLRNGSTGAEYLRRHATGDWGLVTEEDRQANHDALQSGARLMSAYLLPDETKIWVITDAMIDEKGTRPATTLLLPEDY